MKFDILNRWSGRVQFTAEIDCAEDAPMRVKIGLAVLWAYNSGAVLRGAVLRGAVLSDAVLSGADLSGADLRDADLRGADLRDAVLRGADLRDAVLSGADLRGADLSGADLSDADLRGADLRGADLSDADLRGADLRHVKTDLFDVLLRARAEVPGLLAALRAGKINGSTYEGECACLVGTVANVRRADYRSLGAGLTPDSGRPAEQWFMNIREGNMPSNSSVAKITEDWILEFCALAGIEVTAVAA